ncbi:2-C-methyl-D-erythritol 4-phosphate cytidylyltransferase [Lachnospiraceae bacterium 62-35]
MNGRAAERTVAIVLAAGQGKRMKSSIQKQFMLLQEKPLIYYALAELEKSMVDHIILVTSEDEIQYCKERIAAPFHFSKIRRIVAGGKERYHSVYEGLKAAEELEGAKGEHSIVLIHDGARPFITENMIQTAIEAARQFRACAVGMPVKDTIKMADENGFVKETPERSMLWQMQTPQAFDYSLIRRAYEKLLSNPEHQKGITDDAMVVEAMTDARVKLILGDYRNIKVTTPEDMVLAEVFLKEGRGKWEEEKKGDC